MPWKRHVGQLAPAVTDRIINFHLCVQGEGVSVFPAKDPKLIVNHGGRDAGAGSRHRCKRRPAVSGRMVTLKDVCESYPESSAHHIKLSVDYAPGCVIARKG